MRAKKRLGNVAAASCKDVGAALITALALLVIFASLGTAYVTYMSLEIERSRLYTDAAPTASAARAGIFAAIGEIEKALGTPQFEAILQNGLSFEWPVYKGSRAPGGVPLEETQRLRNIVTVSDECARVNINFVPPRVLETILGVDGNTARQIRSSLPRLGESAEPSAEGARRRLASVDDLVVRGLLSKAALDKVDRNLITVYSALDPNDPAGFINVNSAPPEVIAAVLGIGSEAAKRVVAARPIDSLSELAAAAGCDPATFTMAPSPEASYALPKEFCLTSQCFRIVSQATPAAGRKSAQAVRVEAVVFFIGKGRHEIRFWSEAKETPAELPAKLDTAPAAAPEPAPPAPAEATGGSGIAEI